MNKRLIQIIQTVRTDTSGKWISIDNIEQLAELIVRECVSIAHSSDMPGKDIKEHFGLE